MYVLFQILILVLFVFGGTLAKQYCFPERSLMFPQADYEYQFTRPAGSMYDIMKEVGALPDTSGKYFITNLSFLLTRDTRTRFI